MKLRDQLFTGLMGFNLLLTGTAIYNSAVKKTAVSGNLLSNKEALDYRFKLGNIRYTKNGKGQPLLLLHDLEPTACGLDWDYVLPVLSESHTVFIPDLLGCGTSDKPDFIYTNYVFVELLTDFIRTIIGERTDVIASGNAGPLILMTARMNPDLIGNIVMISPDHVSSCMLTPKEEERFLFKFIHLPVFGTYMYNVFTNRRHIAEQIERQDFSSPFEKTDRILEIRYEASHLGQYPQALFASQISNYVKCDIRNALINLKNPILLIYGADQRTKKRNAESFTKLNGNIKTIIIQGCKRYPQIEQPEFFIRAMDSFLKNPA